MTKTQKQKELEKIGKEIESCKICRQKKIGKAVPGEGDPNAKIVFIGEAPGKKEAETGRPFVGRSGTLLRSLIKDAGIDVKKVYITSPVKYLPKHITPTPKEILHGKKHLDKQLAIIQPKIIVLLGSVAAFALLGKKILPSVEHGKTLKQDNRTYFFSYHPAAPLHSPKLRGTLIKDFQKLRRLVQFNH